MICDFDHDGLPDVLVCDAQSNTIRWLRQSPVGTHTESQVGDEVKAPAHVKRFDLDRDGDLDLLIASMGQIMPSNEQIGSVVMIENLGGGQFRTRELVSGIARVTDVRAADFDGNGVFDLALGQFGYAVSMMAWLNDGRERSTPVALPNNPTHLLALTAADMDGDGRIELVTGGFHASPPWDRMSRLMNWKRH